MAKAQELLSRATLAEQQASKYAETIQQQIVEQTPQQAQVQQQNFDPDMEAWSKDNPWFMNNSNPKHKTMTAFALSIDADLNYEGIKPETDPKKYYSEVDKRMRVKYPDFFGASNTQQEVQVEQPIQVEETPKPESKEIKKETIVENISTPKISKPNEIKQNNKVSVYKSSKALASPKVRKFARELGVDINNVIGSQRSGRIIEEDIKNFVSSNFNNPPEEKKIKPIKKLEYEHSDFGEIKVEDIPRIKKIAAPHLVNSWQTIPHVTNCDEADITELEEFRQNLKDTYTGEKKKITPLAFIIKAVVEALKIFPRFNSSIDDIENGKITLKKYFHVGIAVDTPNGLMVPKIRNANQKNIEQISKDLKKVSDDCRNLKIDKKEFYGGSITITSLGGIGGTYFTPIINYPEVAILGVGRTYIKPVYIEGEFKPRTMLPLSLSYDHRIIDGAEGSRFNNELKNNLGKNFAYRLAKQ